jgi:hypothetical protein
VDVGTLLPANPQPFELMQPRQTPLHHPPQPTKPRAMHDTAASDLWADAPRPQRPTVAVKVVAAVGDQHHRSLPGPATFAPHRRDCIHQRQQLGHVVGVGGGQADRERDAGGIADQVVLAARACAVDRACAGRVPPLRARTCEASITARDQSNWSPRRSSANSS